MTVKDLVKYVLKNRKGKVCKDWSLIEIAFSIMNSLKQCTLIYSLNEAGELNGLAWGVADYCRGTLYVSNAITTEKGVLRNLIGYFERTYPTLNLTAHRRGKFVRYNTNHLVRKIYGRTNNGFNALDGHRN